HVLLPKDYVRLRLSGELATDVADASGTLLFDVSRRAWSEEVCAALEIPLDWLLPAHESTEIAGAGDQAAAALGVGAAHPGADPASGPRRARRLRRPLRSPRPRRALAGDARGRRLRAARLARAAPRARCPARDRPRLGRRRAKRALAPDSRLGARPAAREDRIGGALRVRRGAP